MTLKQLTKQLYSVEQLLSDIRFHIRRVESSETSKQQAKLRSTCGVLHANRARSLLRQVEKMRAMADRVSR